MKKVISWISIITSGGWIVYILIAEFQGWSWRITPSKIESIIKFNIPLLISATLGFTSLFKIESKKTSYKGVVYSLSSALLLITLGWLTYEIIAFSYGETWSIKSNKEESVLKFLLFLIPTLILSIINLFDRETKLKEVTEEKKQDNWFSRIKASLNTKTILTGLILILIIQNFRISSELDTIRDEIDDVYQEASNASNYAEQALYEAEEAKDEAEEAKDAAFANVCRYCP